MMVSKWRFLLSLVLIGLLGSAAIAESGKFTFPIHKTPRPVAEIEFKDKDGVLFTLKDFEGKYVLLNVWATWCPPCRKELPDLQGLQRELGGHDFQVVALSTDTGRLQNVLRLYKELGLDESEVFIDETRSAMRSLGIFAMPTTLLLNPKGLEIGRKPGPADWDNDAALAFFREQIGKAESF